MKLSTIAGAAAGGLTSVRSAEQKPSTGFGSLLGDLAAAASAVPSDATSSRGGPRSGVAPAAMLAPADGAVKASGPDGGAFRQRTDKGDQGSSDTAPGAASDAADHRKALGEAVDAAVPVADVLDFVTRAADPIRRAMPLQAAPSTGSAVAVEATTSVMPGTSAVGSAECPGATATSQSAHHCSLPVLAADPDRSASVAEPIDSDSLSSSAAVVLVAGPTFPATRPRSREATGTVEARTSPAASLDAAASNNASLPAAVGVSSLVTAILFPAMIAPSPAAAGASKVEAPFSPASFAPGRGAALPVSAERTTVSSVAQPSQLAGETSAFSVVASVVAQIEPGTVRMESHLGFAAGPTLTPSVLKASKAPPPASPTPADDPASTLPVAPRPSTADQADTAGEPSLLAVEAPAVAPVVPGPVTKMTDVDQTEPTLDAPTAAKDRLVTSPRLQNLAPDAAPVPTAHRPDAPEPSVARDLADAPAATTNTAPLTHLPSPNVTPLIRQVADSVGGLAAAAVPDVDPRNSQVAPARTMTLQLSPAGLGTLSVRLHVVGRALDVQLKASDSRTTALLDHDRGALADALRSKDYQLQTLSVTTHEATTGGGNHAERGTDPGYADSRSSEPDRDGGRGGQGRRDEPGTGGRARSRPQEEAGLDRGGTSLYV